MFTLEKYSGSGSRHTCPACGRAKKFSRYIDTETGRYVADHVGRCDRESSCGYHLKPKEYFAGNPHLRNGRILTPRWKRENVLERKYEGRFSTKKPDFMEPAAFTRTLANYDQNSFVQFLLGLFPFDSEDVCQAVKDYLIGTNKNGETVFPLIDSNRRIRSGKIMLFNDQTGNRKVVRRWIDRETGEPHELKVFWLHKELRLADFELQLCFFGEHLLPKNPGLPIAIVEAEKSAVIGSICKGSFPDMVWLACGGKSNLTVDKLERLGRDRRFILFPDADGFHKWQEIALEASKRGLTVKVSDLIEKRATDAEKAKGFDLADYLIRLQQQRNDPANREAFRDLVEERLAIMIIDGCLTEEEAEAEIIPSGFYKPALS